MLLGFVELDTSQARSGEGTLVEEWLLSDWPAGMFVGIVFINDWHGQA